MIIVAIVPVGSVTGAGHQDARIGTGEKKGGKFHENLPAKNKGIKGKLTCLLGNSL